MEYPIKGPSWKFVSSYDVKIKNYSLLKCFRLNPHRKDTQDEEVKSKALLNRPSEDVPAQLKVEL